MSCFLHVGNMLVSCMCACCVRVFVFYFQTEGVGGQMFSVRKLRPKLTQQCSHRSPTRGRLRFERDAATPVPSHLTAFQAQASSGLMCELLAAGQWPNGCMLGAENCRYFLCVSCVPRLRNCLPPSLARAPFFF